MGAKAVLYSVHNFFVVCKLFIRAMSYTVFSFSFRITGIGISFGEYVGRSQTEKKYVLSRAVRIGALLAIGERCCRTHV